MIDLFQYQRRATNTVTIGSLLMGSSQPIRIQSMATTNTNDTEASVAQAMRIIEANWCVSPLRAPARLRT